MAGDTPQKMPKERAGRDQITNAAEDEIQILAAQNKSQSKKGMNNQRIREVFPQHQRASCEVMYSGHNNSYICLGRDREASLASGYGGKGQTHCGMIDLVAGKAGAEVNDDGIIGPPSTKESRGPNFFTDSARVYISQRCDIDNYFGLAQGSEQRRQPGGKLESVSRSGIGIKADHVRLHARRHIKIVSGRASIQGAGPDGEKNSTGGDNFGAGGIDLIAGNYTSGEQVGILTGMINSAMLFKRATTPKLQPVVKGDNLIECIRWIEKVIGQLQALIMQNAQAISELAGGVGTWAATGGTIASAPIAVAMCTKGAIASIISMLNTVGGLINNIGLEANFCASGGPMYICSRHVNVT
jgi:hypothetical protein